MIPKALEEWDISVIEDLLLKGYYEAEFFDFKEMLPHSKDAEGKERLKKICCAFANSGGGFLVFGIKDDKTLSVHDRLVGIDTSLASNRDFPEQFGNYPANCTPSIAWDFRNPPLRLSTGKVIHIVYIPQSWNVPHAFGGSEQGWQFYKRTNKGNEGMSYEEIKLLFLGFYEKRLKLQLLIAELESILTTANNAKESINSKPSSVYLSTFDLGVTNTILTDSYTVMANKPVLLAALKNIRTTCQVSNNLTNIQMAILSTISYGDINERKLTEHGEQQLKLYSTLLDLVPQAISILKEITVP